MSSKTDLEAWIDALGRPRKERLAANPTRKLDLMPGGRGKGGIGRKVGYNECGWPLDFRRRFRYDNNVRKHFCRPDGK